MALNAIQTLLSIKVAPAVVPATPVVLKPGAPKTGAPVPKPATLGSIGLDAAEADIQARIKKGLTRDQAIAQRKKESDALIAKEAKERADKENSLLGKLEKGANDLQRAAAPLVKTVAEIATSPAGKAALGLIPGGDVVNLAIATAQVVSSGNLTGPSAQKIAAQASQTLSSETGVNIPPSVVLDVVSGNPQKAVTAIATTGLGYAANQAGIPVPPSVIAAVATGNLKAAGQEALKVGVEYGAAQLSVMTGLPLQNLAQVSVSSILDNKAQQAPKVEIAVNLQNLNTLLGASPPASAASSLAIAPGKAVADKIKVATGKALGVAYAAKDAPPKPFGPTFATQADYDSFASDPRTQGGTIGHPK